jgi:hypothetical protein
MSRTIHARDVPWTRPADPTLCGREGSSRVIRAAAPAAAPGSPGPS